MLGDPIELAALANAFTRSGLRDGRQCAIGSVKSNIGHLEAAAGVAGVTKVVLQMQHRTLVPSLDAEVLNAQVDLSGTPFRVQTTLGSWPGAQESGCTMSAARGGEFLRRRRRECALDPGEL